MRISIAALLLAALINIPALAVPSAQAAPAQVNVRIEGRSETLFEGPIWTEGHEVQAASDTKARACDGIDSLDPQNTAPGPTPTAASADAMGMIGETFDAQWYPGYEDYFITRWGPDREAEGMSWGILVNNVFTNVGGCQYELSAGTEVLWAYNAFGGKPFLALLPTAASYDTGPRPLTATAELGKPFEVEVLDYSDTTEDVPPTVPTRAGSSPFEGADVSPVKTSAKGFEEVQTASPQTVKTNAQGRASITFTEPGWHRIKATALNGEGKENAIRSNRLDVCVPAAQEAGCGTAPAEDEVRTPAYVEAERTHQAEVEQAEAAKRREAALRREAETTTSATDENGSPLAAANTPGALTAAGNTLAGPSRIQGPTLNDRGAAHGLVGVSWQIAEPGVGLSAWRIASRTLTSAGSTGFVTRATGASATAALLALPAGALYELQITFTDVLGRSSTTAIGKVLVPLDDRWSGLHYRGGWQRRKQSGAWLGTVSRTGAGAQVSALLSAGRPVFQLRGAAGDARVEVRAGSRRELYAIAGAPAGALRQITAATRRHAGMVSLRVLRGTVDLDGVAVEP